MKTRKLLLLLALAATTSMQAQRIKGSDTVLPIAQQTAERCIKTLAVSYDGQHYAAPTLENAINKTYPIVRPLYYYYNRKNASAIAPLLDFVLSAAGQKIIKESGYIPVHNE